MAGVYSTRFYVGGVTAGNNTSVTVPPNVVWVIRSINVTCFAAGSTGATIFAANSPFWCVNQLTPYVTVSWYGRQVLEAGEQLSVAAGGASAFFYISGYQLV